eukprot:9500774-Pyramimonas_sp.AAC.1
MTEYVLQVHESFWICALLLTTPPLCPLLLLLDFPRSPPLRRPLYTTKLYTNPNPTCDTTRPPRLPSAGAVDGPYARRASGVRLAEGRGDFPDGARGVRGDSARGGGRRQGRQEGRKGQGRRRQEGGQAGVPQRGRARRGPAGEEDRVGRDRGRLPGASDSVLPRVRGGGEARGGGEGAG